jgi:precorrin-3B synthase
MKEAATRFEVKGWCPGALRPMESGDGLIVRIRPRNASVSRAQLQGIATAAEAYGNGHVDLTRRANLQIRGATAETLIPLQHTLRALGLLDETVEGESVRNILVNPLAGIDPSEILDMRPLALELGNHLVDRPFGRRLPPKFSFVLDGGGRLGLAGERADIRLLACAVDGRPMIAIARNGADWLGMTEPEDAISAACAIIAGKSAKLQPVGTPSVQSAYIKGTCVGYLPLGAECSVFGLGVAFGRLEARQLRVLAEIAPEIRLSPWRALYLPVAGDAAGMRVMATAREIGLATEIGDPSMRIQACPGRPACRSGHTDTRADAAKVAQWMAAIGFTGTAHVSGCAKGCASSAPADITLVGSPGGYRLLRHATARAEGGILLAASDIPGGLYA